MFKTQLKCQKILAYAILIVAALSFVYSLGLVTDLYDMLYYATKELDGNYYSEIDGALIYYDIQPFNNALLICSIVLILTSLTFFITNGHKRRLYYVGNYVSTGIVCASNVAVAIVGIVGVSKFRAQYLAIDFEAVKEYAEFWGTLYTESTFWFDIGYVVFALMIVTAFACAGNLIWKILLTKRERAMIGSKLSEEVSA